MFSEKSCQSMKKTAINKKKVFQILKFIELIYELCKKISSDAVLNVSMNLTYCFELK